MREEEEKTHMREKESNVGRVDIAEEIKDEGTQATYSLPTRL